METIWDDLREHFEQAEISEEHKTLLESRRRRVESGESRLLDWDEVKSRRFRLSHAEEFA